MRRFIIVALCLALVSGCGVIGDLRTLFGGGQVDTETGSSKLIPFSSEQELVDYFSDQVVSSSNRNASSGLDWFWGGIFLPTPSPMAGADDTTSLLDDSSAPPTAGEGVSGDSDGTAGTGSDDFSQTTIQEQGVDEADVVKTDGTNLYIIDDGVLKIVDVSGTDQPTLLSQLAIEGNGREIYLHGDKVVALTSVGGMFISVDFMFADEPGISADLRYERPNTIVTIIDVSDPSAASVISTTKFEGTSSASRMIDGVLHFIVATYETDYVDVLPDAGQPSVDVSGLDAPSVLPTYQRTAADGTESAGSVVAWDEMFRPTDPDGYGVVTLISLDVDADAAFTGVGVVAEPGLIYSSLEAMYITDTEYTFWDNARTTTDIYKFKYEGRGAVPTATGSVLGRILNQYSMSEHNGHLRVATTLDGDWDFSDGWTETTNSVYVLGETDDGLETVGSIEGIAPGETIQSARFLGDRGYLVTFEQIDPFFTLDLSVPTAPVVAGELKVPGFSTFIVPMDENHLLTVGEYIPEDGMFWNTGVQLSIFDVTDFANPVRSANVVLGEDSYAYSEAMFNPKAFTYFAERDLVALPVTIDADGGGFIDVVFEEDDVVDDRIDAGDVMPEPTEVVVDISPVVPTGFEGIVVYSVTAEGGFAELGRISTRLDDPSLWTSFTRSIFIEENIFAVTDRVVRGASLGALETITHELVID